MAHIGKEARLRAAAFFRESLLYLHLLFALLKHAVDPEQYQQRETDESNLCVACDIHGITYDAHLTS